MSMNKVIAISGVFAAVTLNGCSSSDDDEKKQREEFTKAMTALKTAGDKYKRDPVLDLTAPNKNTFYCQASDKSGYTGDDADIKKGYITHVQTTIAGWKEGKDEKTKKFFDFIAQPLFKDFPCAKGEPQDTPEQKAAFEAMLKKEGEDKKPFVPAKPVKEEAKKDDKKDDKKDGKDAKANPNRISV